MEREHVRNSNLKVVQLFEYGHLCVFVDTYTEMIKLLDKRYLKADNIGDYDNHMIY